MKDQQPVVTHHRLQSIGDILVAMQCHPLDMMRLVIYESHMEEYEDSVTEVLFVPLGHQRYVRLFRDINDINCHPTLGTKRYIGDTDTDDYLKVPNISSFNAPMLTEEDVLKYIAKTFYEYAEPQMHATVTLYIGNNDVYEEGEGYESSYEKEISIREEMPSALCS